MGPILHTIIGAGLKLGANVLNSWLDEKREAKLLLKGDAELLKLLAEQQQRQSNDPFVKVTRRILFTMLTGTYCFLMVWYALNPDIQYTIIKPTNTSNVGFLGFLFGSDSYETITLTGGLMLASFIDLLFMVVGFYSLPSKRR